MCCKRSGIDGRRCRAVCGSGSRARRATHSPLASGIWPGGPPSPPKHIPAMPRIFEARRKELSNSIDVIIYEAAEMQATPRR